MVDPPALCRDTSSCELGNDEEEVFSVAEGLSGEEDPEASVATEPLEGKEKELLVESSSKEELFR